MDFVKEFFIDPILYFGGYNIVNTLVYGIILILVAVFLVFPFLNKRGIKFDLKFALTVLLYVLIGSSMRVIEDLHYIQRSANPFEPGFWIISPGIYIAVGLFTIIAAWFCNWFSKKFNTSFYVVFAGIGFIFAIFPLMFDIMHFKEVVGFSLAIVMALLFGGITLGIAGKFLPEIKRDDLGKLAIMGQALDGTATFIALQFFNCAEQHVVSSIITGFLPLAFPIIKICLVLAIIYYVDREIEHENLKAFIKLFLIIMGFAPGLRDLLTLAVGTCSGI